MLLKNGKVTPEGIAKLKEYADLLDWECPNHLMAILDEW